MKLDLNLHLDPKQLTVHYLVTTRRYLLIAVGLLSAGVLILLFALLPQIQAAFEFRDATNLEQEKVTALQNKAKALQNIDITQDPENTKKVDQALPSEKPLLQLLASMNQAAQQTGVTLSNIETNPGKLASQSASIVVLGAGKSASSAGTILVPPVTAALPPPGTGATTAKKTNNGVEALTVQVKVAGQLAQINNFLDVIERSAPITDVTEIDLSNRERLIENETTRDFTADLKLTTYYFTQSIAVAIDTPLPQVGAKEQVFLDTLNSFIFPDITKQLQIQGGGSQDLFGVDGNGQLP